MDEIKNMVKEIVELKTKCNEARRLHGKEPIFHPSSESERLALKLSSLICKTEDDFRTFIDIIFKLIIESSGNGRRLPEDPRVDSIKRIIRGLRNHFFHIREYCKPAEVRRKYK